MDSKTMILKCVNCKETYLSDHLCDERKCPKCSWYTRRLGYMEELEKDLEKIASEVRKAKKNGYIREHKKGSNDVKIHRRLYADGEVVEEKEEVLCGMDLSSNKDISVGISFNSERFIEDLESKVLETIEEHRKNIGNYIQCRYE